MSNEEHFTKQKLWGGRFTGETDPLMHAYNQSLSYDKRMYAADVHGSKAYARALARIGVLTNEEADKIHSGLDAVKNEWETNTFKVHPQDEDIHTANERRLTEIIGSVAGKLHTGRSRNDQVVTDVRLWLLEQTALVEGYLKELIGVISNRADKEIDVLMPGYTHLQPAQPIRWSHWLCSHAFSFANDLERLRDLIPRLNKSPLGCGALAGHPFSIDRETLASYLGFKGVIENSMNGVADRDFIVEWLMWATLTLTHMSRFAEDLIIYSTSEFGFVTASDAYSTGSSIMPQKKNPDSLELLRGKSGRIFGQMTGFLMSLKGLPSTYNKDLQEDKEPLFDCVDSMKASLQIATGVISTLNIHPENMKKSLGMDMLATDLADYLVRKGVPFRETHHISGRCVAFAESKKIQLSEITLEQLQEIDSRFTEDVMKVWDFEASVDRRNAIGGTARSAVERQVKVLQNLL
ncbi:argininosuccinate lyase [Wallemia mellicola]|uniref:Argininosuccinate lyase n=1 Tax=Wallemia mellicola TaxID=1708541 RepID=A0A4T0TLY7_9BASI|nr:argininosuccinate lyase [Wallemia mellicola]